MDNRFKNFMADICLIGLAIGILFLVTSCAKPTTGFHNIHKIDDYTYRGEQPTEEDMYYLRDILKIKTIINLDDMNTDPEIDGITYHHVRMKAYWPQFDHVKEVFSLFKTSEKPVFIHCQAGADRTGLISAIYRVKYNGWSKYDAKKEMMTCCRFHDEVWNKCDEFFDRISEEEINKL